MPLDECIIHVAAATSVSLTPTILLLSLPARARRPFLALYLSPRALETTKYHCVLDCVSLSLSLFFLSLLGPCILLRFQQRLFRFFWNQALESILYCPRPCLRSRDRGRERERETFQRGKREIFGKINEPIVRGATREALYVSICQYGARSDRWDRASRKFEMLIFFRAPARICCVRWMPCIQNAGYYRGVACCQAFIFVRCFHAFLRMMLASRHFLQLYKGMRCKSAGYMLSRNFKNDVITPVGVRSFVPKIRP